MWASVRLKLEPTVREEMFYSWLFCERPNWP